MLHTLLHTPLYVCINLNKTHYTKLCSNSAPKIFFLLLNQTIQALYQHSGSQYQKGHIVPKGQSLILGRYNQIRQSCKGFEEMIEITNSMTINELGVFKFLNQGA
jgi:hypothetical protein